MAEFSGIPTTGVRPLSVTFLDLTTGSVTSWAWDFGDIGTSTLQNPTHSYASVGTYTVTLTSTGPGGFDGETKLDYITVVEPPPVVDFAATPTGGTAPLAVSFTDATTPAATSWSWDFGDMGSSTQQNPSHSYATPGTYTVSLSATGPGGSDVEVKVDLISVLTSGSAMFRNGLGINPVCYSALPPVIGTTWLAEVDSSVFAGATATVIFGRLSPIPGIPTVFGELLIDTGSLVLFDSVKPASGGVDQHAFPLPNDMSLVGNTGATQGMILGPAGTGQFCNAADFLMGYARAGQTAAALFDSDVTAGPPPLLVSFSDQSTGDTSSWRWDFGEGTTSNVQNPTHTYALAGTYSVSLVVEGESGFDTLIKLDEIIVAAPPVAEFVGSPLTGNAPLSAVFTDLTSGFVSTWSWDFGDGESSSLQDPMHLYPNPGTYTVSMTATGPGGSSVETKIDYITTVPLGSVAAFSASPLAGAIPLAVTFTNLSAGTITSWSWDFGDSGSSSLQHPTHVYSALGTYTVTLSVDGPGGLDVETKPGYITVVPPVPAADFSGTPLLGNQPLTVAFTDATTGTVSAWDWAFGDGGTSSLQNPSYVFALFGTYTVSLTATGSGGADIETKSDYVTVLPPPPTVNFVGSPTSGATPLAVSFNDTSIGLISQWNWDFGDGNSSTQQHPTNTYLLPGTYTVSLTVTGSGGSSMKTESDYVFVTIPSLRDGSFELQFAGGAPLSPWSVSGGSGHLIQPDLGATDDNTLPAEGLKWAQVSSAGTSAALPPSNPGGVGTAPMGAAGFSQTFVFDPLRPGLAFYAAFLLGGPAAAPGTNDFMSVDVTDGSTVVNLYYADTFSAFPNTSSIHGLPMTEMETVMANLGTLFPGAVYGMPLTLSVQAGNGGDASEPSLGYVDDFRLRGLAGAIYRNGLGTNPACYVADPPILGTFWSAEVDHRDRPGATFAVILLRTTPISGTILPGFGELLAGGASLLNFVKVADPSGVTSHGFPVPADPFLMGTGISQGLVLGPALDQTFCNAADLTLGFAPREARPQAAFLASPTTGPAPLAVTFTDQSVGTVTSWNWSFGDGASGLLQDPNHVYADPGTYTVALRVSGPGGFDIETKFDVITVP